MRNGKAFCLTALRGLLVISGLLLLQPASAGNHEEMIKEALDSCAHYVFPNSQARLPGRDWAKYDHDNYIRYSSIAKQFASKDGLNEIISFMQGGKKSRRYDWPCALDMVGRSGVNEAISILQKYRDKDHSGDGGEMVDYYLKEYEARPRSGDWKPKPYINYQGQ